MRVLTSRSVALLTAILAVSTYAARADDAVDAGRHMYRDGVLPSGEPLAAIVGGDVPVLGTQFSCGSCHGRSGMGTAEGAYIVPPIAGPFLYADSPQPKRPAYTAATLATVLRTGVTPAGRALKPELMPRYAIDDDAVAALAAYLETLSAGNSPGVDSSAIRFATVVAADVEPAERAAMLAVLEQFFAEKNRQTRLESERFDRIYTPDSKLPSVFRQWVLEEWAVTGPPATWGAQLDRLYADTPVFALVSGRGTGSWSPVDRFCERHEIPCLFPSADLPDVRDDDFYTLHFSGGLRLEADLIAHHLELSPPAKVVQVHCSMAAGEAAALLRVRLEASDINTEDLAFDCDGAFPVAALAARMGADSAAVLWLRDDTLDAIEQPLPAGALYFSSTLLDGTPPGRLIASRSAFMAHPYVLPGAIDPAMRRFELWARTRGVALSAPRLQAEAFFACLALSDAVKHMRRYFVRDFVLDMLDHAQGLALFVPQHPRPTIGPGQRFLTKGGYVLPIVDGALVTAEAAWILP